MRTARLTFALLTATLALAVVPVVAAAQASSTPSAAVTRCDAAGRLARAGVEDVAGREFEKLLKGDAERLCAVEGLGNQDAKSLLMGLAAKQDETSELSACDAGTELQKAGIDDQAKSQFEKAAGEAATRQCGVDGLKALHEDQDGASWDEVWDAVWGWLKTAWPWMAAVASFWFLALILRLFLSAGDIRVVPKGGDAKLGTRVVAAANATGSSGRPPAKLIAGEEQGLADGAVASLTKLLKVPGGAPIDALLTVATWPLRFQRLRVGYSEGGGWAVLDVRFYRLMKRKRYARLAVQLERETTEDRQEVLSLIAGAWLATVLIADKPGAPVKKKDWDAVIAHAYFRAGANLQDRALPDRALACYAAMDRITRANGTPYRLPEESAPTAWIGARLNQMMLLKGQGRVREALALARATHHAPGSWPGNDQVDWFGERQLTDLRRRATYLRAVLLEDLLWEPPVPGLSTDDLEDLAKVAASELDDELNALTPADLANPLQRPMRLVLACHRIRFPSGEPITPATIRYILNDEVNRAVRIVTAPPLTAAAFYDAACALALLRDPEPEVRDEAVRYVKLAVLACSVASRPRVRKAVAADPMLARLAPAGVGSLEKYKQALAEAVGTDDDDVQPGADGTEKAAA